MKRPTGSSGSLSSDCAARRLREECSPSGPRLLVAVPDAKFVHLCYAHLSVHMRLPMHVHQQTRALTVSSMSCPQCFGHLQFRRNGIAIWDAACKANHLLNEPISRLKGNEKPHDLHNVFEWARVVCYNLCYCRNCSKYFASILFHQWHSHLKASFECYAQWASSHSLPKSQSPPLAEFVHPHLAQTLVQDGTLDAFSPWVSSSAVKPNISSETTLYIPLQLKKRWLSHIYICWPQLHHRRVTSSPQHLFLNSLLAGSGRCTKSATALLESLARSSWAFTQAINAWDDQKIEFSCSGWKKGLSFQFLWR